MAIGRDLKERLSFRRTMTSYGSLPPFNDGDSDEEFTQPTPPRRRPYIYTGPGGGGGSSANLSATAAAAGGGGPPTRPMDPAEAEAQEQRAHNMAIRYRLFSRLDPGGYSLVMPSHIVPELFSVLPFADFKDEAGKQNSVVTIFSIWNTMMGTSLLAMPWAVEQAGALLAVLLILFVGAVALYTAYRVVESPNGLVIPGCQTAEFSDVCRHLLGDWGSYVATVSSVAVLLGGITVYWVLMSSFLYYTGTVVYEALQPNSSTIPVMENKTLTCDIYCYNASALMDRRHDWASTSTFDRFWTLQGSVPCILALFTFPLFNLKSPTFFTKFNMLGTISVLYLLCFVASKLAECGLNVNFTDVTSIHYTRLFNWSAFPALSGTVTLSFFIHNAIITILRNQKNPENNARDLSIGYLLAAICYIFIGYAFFAAFPIQRSCISDNFLNNFGTGDVLSATARVFLLFQMITVLPLLVFLVRSQFLYALVGNDFPSYPIVAAVNLGVVLIAVLVAIFYPHVGSLLRYVGAISGLIYVFALPCAIYIAKRRLRGTLTRKDLVIHGAIVTAGFANLIAQFII